MIGRAVDLATITRRPFESVRSTICGVAIALTSPRGSGAMRSPSGRSSLAARIAGGTVRKVGTGAGLRQLSSGTPSGRALSS